MSIQKLTEGSYGGMVLMWNPQPDDCNNAIDPLKFFGDKKFRLVQAWGENQGPVFTRYLTDNELEFVDKLFKKVLEMFKGNPICYDIEGIYVKDCFVNEEAKEKTIYMICCSDRPGAYTGQGYVPRVIIMRRKTTDPNFEVVRTRFVEV